MTNPNSADALTSPVYGDMEFHMGLRDEAYDGASVSFWSGPDSNIAVLENRLAAYSHPQSPRRIMIFGELEDWMGEKAEFDREYIEEILPNPDEDDVRFNWDLICDNLASHELLTTGGLTVHRDWENKVPTDFQREVVERYIDLHADAWPGNEGMKHNIRREAFDRLHAAKYNMLRVEEEAAKERAERKTAKPSAPTVYRVMENAVAEMPKSISEWDLIGKTNKLIKRIDFDGNAQARWIELIAQNTHLGKVEARKLVKGAVRTAARAEVPNKKAENRVPDVGEWSDHEMADWSQQALTQMVDDDANPVLYRFQGDVASIRDGQRQMLTENQFGAALNTYTKFQKSTQSGDIRGCFAPKQVVTHNFNRSEKTYPELKEVKTSPFFTVDGRRVDQAGYDAEAETFLDFDLDFPAVSDQPTEEEVFEAKELIFGDLLRDFPLDGIIDPDEFLDRALHNKQDTQPSASAAHSVCLLLERAVRPMINGPTPVYAPTKPLPGTGAGRLVSSVTLAATGRKAAAETMPRTEEEYTKVMGAQISQGDEYVFFDNMNAALDLGPFASNVSEGRVRTRLLGSSRMIEAVVSHTWIAAANNIKGTAEILRRMVMIELDAKVPNPELRTGFKHDDLEGWVLENRPKLIWAILTLIQNWIAKGMNPWTGRPKASFEAWSRVMGGILRDADIRGFLENEERLRSYGATGGESGVEVLVQSMAASREDGAIFRSGGTSEVRGRSKEPVFSIKDALNEADDGKPLLIDGWGYNREDGTYNHPRNIKVKFRDAARRSYGVTLFECSEDSNQEAEVRYNVSFDEHPDPQSPQQFYWIMNKTKIDD